MQLFLGIPTAVILRNQTYVIIGTKSCHLKYLNSSNSKCLTGVIVGIQTGAVLVSKQSSF